VRAALSPSRAADFIQCPLLYRFRTIDRLPQAPSPAAARGTVVHAVLERLFDLPATERTPAAARELVGPQWQVLLDADPELASMFPADDGAAMAEWLASANVLVERWFTLEDPSRLEPAERELYVETTLADGLVLRGYVDRLDVAPTGELRVVDYKTGKAPSELFEAQALFQMRSTRSSCGASAGSSRARCSWSTSVTVRCCGSSRTKPSCWPPSASCVPCGKRSSARP